MSTVGPTDRDGDTPGDHGVAGRRRAPTRIPLVGAR